MVTRLKQLNLAAGTESAVKFIAQDEGVRVNWVPNVIPSSDCIKTITLPSFDATNIDEETLMNIRLYSDHETAHIKYTNRNVKLEHRGLKWITFHFEGRDYVIDSKERAEEFGLLVNKLQSKRVEIRVPSPFSDITNALEDVRIEKLLGKKYVGCKENFERGHEKYAYNHEKMKDAPKLKLALLLLCTHNPEEICGIDLEVKKILELAIPFHKIAVEAESTYTVAYCAAMIFFIWKEELGLREKEKRALKKAEMERMKKENKKPKIIQDDGRSDFFEDDKKEEEQLEMESGDGESPEVVKVDDGIDDIMKKFDKLVDEGKINIGNRIALFDYVKKNKVRMQF